MIYVFNLLQLCIGTNTLGVGTPCTVLFADKCTPSLVGNQYFAVYSLAL